jgi:hypothetical protein
VSNGDLAAELVTKRDPSVVTNPEPPAAVEYTSAEDAIARALADAAAAGRWDVVAALARELEARRRVTSC